MTASRPLPSDPLAIEPTAVSPGPGAPWPAWADRRGPTRPQVSVVIPTYDEADNLPVLLDRLDIALADLDYEIVVVDDDSPDLTWQVAEAAAGRSRRIQVLRRIGRRGLSSAVVEGLALAQGDVLAVLDADLQHDESVLPTMIEAVTRGGADVCIGTRAAAGGSYGSFGPGRRAVSWVGAELARTLLGVEVSDPMSGFFVLSRNRYEQTRSEVTGRGFKILLELLVRGPRPQVAEVGYAFRERTAGTTKLSSSVAGAYLASLAELALARLQSTELLLFGSLALVGAAIRASLWSLADVLGPGAGVRIAAAEIAILAEFLLHDRRTFVSRRKVRGRLLRFHLVSLHGLAALAGLGPLIDHLVTTGSSTATVVAALGLAGAGTLGVVVSAYVLNGMITWPQRHSARPVSSGGSVPRLPADRSQPRPADNP